MECLLEFQFAQREIERWEEKRVYALYFWITIESITLQLKTQTVSEKNSRMDGQVYSPSIM